MLQSMKVRTSMKSDQLSAALYDFTRTMLPLNTKCSSSIRIITFSNLLPPSISTPRGGKSVSETANLWEFMLTGPESFSSLWALRNVFQPQQEFLAHFSFVFEKLWKFVWGEISSKFVENVEFWNVVTSTLAWILMTPNNANLWSAIYYRQRSSWSIQDIKMNRAATCRNLEGSWTNFTESSEFSEQNFFNRSLKWDSHSISSHYSRMKLPLTFIFIAKAAQCVRLQSSQLWNFLSTLP